jgi:signal transduction histidine kinase
VDADLFAHLQALTETGAIALANTRSYTESHREIRRRDALRIAVASISAELDLDTLLGRVIANAVGLVDADRGLISLVESDGTARIHAVHNLPANLVGHAVRPGEGMSGQVLLTRGPVLVTNYATDVRQPLGDCGVQAGLAVPMWWQGELLGVCGVFSDNPARAFDADDREVMELLFNHVAIAVENARLYGELRDSRAELQSQVEEMVGLQRLGTLLLEVHDFDRVLQSICEQLKNLTNAGGVGIALLEDDPRFLEMRTVVGPSADALRGVRIPTQGSFAGEALRTNQPQRSDDAQHDPRGYKQTLVLGNTRAILSVAMKTRRRTIGVLSIYNKEGEAGFSDRDAELATFFANQAAVAIENARLYEQTREYAVVEERNRLARELHDSVTQSLFSVSLLSEAALNLLDRDPAKARERLERANELAQGALAEMRALIFQLRPMALQEEGLLSAVKKHLNALQSRHRRQVELQVSGAAGRLPAQVEDAAFGIIQESLNNVVKHAHAERTLVLLEFDPRELRVTTVDNGVGFDPSVPRPSNKFGMSSMRERAEAIGGRLLVESAPTQGTRIIAELPIPDGN